MTPNPTPYLNELEAYANANPQVAMMYVKPEHIEGVASEMRALQTENAALKVNLEDARVMGRIWSEDGGREKRYRTVVHRLWKERGRNHAETLAFARSSIRVNDMLEESEAENAALKAERDSLHRQVEALRPIVAELAQMDNYAGNAGGVAQAALKVR